MQRSALSNDDARSLAGLLAEALDQLRARPDLARLRLDEAALALVPPPRGALSAWRRRLLTDHIEAGLDGPLRTQALADLAGLSVSGLSRGFMASFGCSPQLYVQRRRVARAQAGMRDTDTPLAQIALDCGFGDQTHFCRIFRRETGLSPARWRAAMRLEAGRDRDLHPPPARVA